MFAAKTIDSITGANPPAPSLSVHLNDLAAPDAGVKVMLTVVINSDSLSGSTVVSFSQEKEMKAKKAKKKKVEKS